MDEVKIFELTLKLNAIGDFQAENRNCHQCEEATGDSKNFIDFKILNLKETFKHSQEVLSRLENEKACVKQTTKIISDRINLRMIKLKVWKDKLLHLLAKICVACQSSNSWNVYEQLNREVNKTFPIAGACNVEYPFILEDWIFIKERLAVLSTMFDLIKLERISMVGEFKILLKYFQKWISHIKTHDDLDRPAYKISLAFLSIEVGDRHQV